MSHSIAIIGANGFLGKPTIEALLSKPFVSEIKLPIKIVTTSGKSPVDSDKLEIVSSGDGYAGLFEGVDAVINLAGALHCADPRIIEALVSAKVKLYIPSQFGTDLEAVDSDFPGFLGFKTEHSKQAREAGLKVVDVLTSMFMTDDQTFLGLPFAAFEFDAEKKELEVVGDESILVNPSFLEDIGKSVAALVTRDDYAGIPDTIRIFSDRTTLGDLITHYEKEHSVKLTKKYVDPQQVISQAKVKYQNFTFGDFFFYLKAFFAMGEGGGIISEKKNDRELINPGESLFKWTKFIV